MTNYPKPVLLTALFLTLAVIVTGNEGKDGLIGWWRFDGLQDTALQDRSGHQKTAAVIASNPELAKEKTRCGLKFDGVDDYADLPEISRNRNFTIESRVFINSSDKTGWQTIVATRDGWIFYEPDNTFPVRGMGKIFLGIHADRNGGEDSKSATSYNWIFPIAGIEEKWIHLAFIGSEDDNARLYINGRKIDIGKRKTDSGMTGDYFTSVGAFIGKSSSGADTKTRFFSGIIAEVKIYNRVLSEDEIKDASKL